MASSKASTLTGMCEIDGQSVGLILARAGKTLTATMVIGQPSEAAPLGDDNVAVVLEGTDGRLLPVNAYPPPGFLPETTTQATSACVSFGFAVAKPTPLRRAILVVRGAFGEIDLKGAKY